MPSLNKAGITPPAQAWRADHQSGLASWGAREIKLDIYRSCPIGYVACGAPARVNGSRRALQLEQVFTGLHAKWHLERDSQMLLRQANRLPRGFLLNTARRGEGCEIYVHMQRRSRDTRLRLGLVSRRFGSHLLLLRNTWFPLIVS